MKTVKLIPVLVAGLLAAPVFAQAVASDTQRNVNQEKRIEAGLQSGALTTREAARLEREQSNIDRTEANALKDGHLSKAEQRRINRMENRASGDINAAEHNAALGNPNGKSDKRMQADVARNIKQEQRTEAGIKDGSLTNREVARIERGEAKIDRKEYLAGRDGHVGAREQARIQRAENHESHVVHKERTNKHYRG